MKSTEVDERLSTTTTTVLFQRKPTSFKIESTEWEIYIKSIDMFLWKVVILSGDWYQFIKAG